MSIVNAIHRNIDEHSQVIRWVREFLANHIEEASRVISKSLANSGTIFWCGNGGSAADSQHLAAELVGRFKRNRRPLRSAALTTDSSVLTCIANDYSYEDVFARQVEALGRQGDVLIGLSTSGSSPNVVNAFEAAKRVGMTTVALLGKDGGGCGSLAQLSLIVPSQDTARIQEAHILIGHILCELIEMELRLA